MKGNRTTETGAQHPDARLTGRTYAIPFEDVWQGALRVIREKSSRWSLDTADDQEGLIVADVRGLHGSLDANVRITVVLDENGQTRVDAGMTMPRAVIDFGIPARRLDRFFRALDREAPREHERRIAITNVSSGRPR